MVGFVGSCGVWSGRGRRGCGAARERRREVVVAVEQNTLVAVGTAVLGTLGGIGLLVWTEQQGKRSESRPNRQVCFDCKGNKVVQCNICGGTGKDPVFKSDDEPCQYCDGKGELECGNCNATGIQPRFLDRLSPEDFMD